MPQSITPFLWFDTQALEAAEFYTSVFPNSRIVEVTHYTDAGPLPTGRVMTVQFELDGQVLTALNGGPQYTFSEAISLCVTCEDQAEIDYYWDKLTAGGEEGPCGWLKDRYGLSWQIVPSGLGEIFGDADPAAARRAMEAMFKMHKLDIAALLDARAAGTPA